MQPTPVELGLAFVGTSAVVVLGLVWMLDARKPLGQLMGLGVCIAPSAALLGMYAGAVTVLNIFQAGKNAEAIWPLNYAPARMTAIVGIIEAVIFLQGFWLLRKRDSLPLERWRQILFKISPQRRKERKENNENLAIFAPSR